MKLEKRKESPVWKLLKQTYKKQRFEYFVVRTIPIFVLEKQSYSYRVISSFKALSQRITIGKES